jgi:F-type H+-transporting ATPase subunit epsilon
MNSEHLVLQIITPDGKTLKEKQINVLVVRRKEKRFELGSEIAVFPRHAPTLIRIPIAPLRYRKEERTTYVAAGGGFVEIKDNQILVVTPRFEKIRSDDPAPSLTAWRMTEQWRQEHKEFRREMIGYLQA